MNVTGNLIKSSVMQPQWQKPNYTRVKRKQEELNAVSDDNSFKEFTVKREQSVTW